MYVEVFSANSFNKLTILKLFIAATETWWSPLYHMFVLSSQVSVYLLIQIIWQKIDESLFGCLLNSLKSIKVEVSPS